MRNLTQTFRLKIKYWSIRGKITKCYTPLNEKYTFNKNNNFEKLISFEKKVIITFTYQALCIVKGVKTFCCIVVSGEQHMTEISSFEIRRNMGKKFI